MVKKVNAVLNNLYSNFILRDLLSFFLPGLLTLFSLALYVFNFQNIKLFILKYYIDQPNFIIILLSFLISYVIGYGLQCIAAGIRLVKYYPKNKIKTVIEGGEKKSAKSVKFNKTKIQEILYYKRLSNFFEKADVNEIKFHERMTVLKQFSFNNAFALILNSILLCSYYIVPNFKVILTGLSKGNTYLDNLNIIAFIIIVLLITIFLIIENRGITRRQKIFEESVIDKKQPVKVIPVKKSK